MQLIQPLFTGPLDIIGDVHGEYGALCSLLFRLGYDGNGNHPEGRRLVFVGDLVDRGPDSIAVAYLVRHLIQRGNAQAVIGNHELNLLRPSKKGGPFPDKRHGNHWFQSLPEALVKGSSQINFQNLANEQNRQDLSAFFRTLPVALERDDLRVVHACWDQQSIDKIRARNTPLQDLFIEYEEQIIDSHPAQSTKIEQDLREQNLNPIKVITSGLEKRAEEPYEAGGKVRHLKRVQWWKSYTGPMVVFGHYWRRREANPNVDPETLSPPDKKTVPYLFEDTPMFSTEGSTMCIDYSVGGRYYERHKANKEGDFGCYLAAFRTYKSPGRYTLLFDDGKEIQLI